MPTRLLPSVSSWEQWAALFVDTAVWRPVIEHLWSGGAILSAATGVKGIESIAPGFPGTCAVFVINESVVVKFFPPMVAGDYTRERAAYRLLESRVTEMPRLLASGVFDDRQPWPWLITSFRPGAAWRDVRTLVPEAQRLELGRALGERLRQVHDTPLPTRAEWLPSDLWRQLVAKRLAVALEEVRAKAILPQVLVEDARRLLQATDWHATPPRLLHADLTEDHVLVEARASGWAMSGLIDWADAEVGASDYEWVALYFGFCGGDTTLFRAVLAGYDPGRLPPPRERLLAFTLLHRFGSAIIAHALPEPVRRELAGLDELAGRLFPDIDP